MNRQITLQLSDRVIRRAESQAKHSALAANLFERLPDFSLAPIDEIIDVRQELRPYLDRFRGGISTYAEGIQSAPWNRDFAAEADELFIKHVKSGILVRLKIGSIQAAIRFGTFQER